MKEQEFETKNKAEINTGNGTTDESDSEEKVRGFLKKLAEQLGQMGNVLGTLIDFLGK